jgi:hypothetical protein
VKKERKAIQANKKRENQKDSLGVVKSISTPKDVKLSIISEMSKRTRRVSENKDEDENGKEEEEEEDKEVNEEEDEEVDEEEGGEKVS